MESSSSAVATPATTTIKTPAQDPNSQTGSQDNEEQRKWKGSFTFVQCADTQLGLIDKYFHDVKDDDKVTWSRELKYLNMAIDAINALEPKPKFMIICGDLVDAFPITSARVRDLQVTDLKNTLKRVDPEIKLVCVCGNHDVGDTPTPASIANYRTEFGPDFFSFWSHGCKMLVLNSQYYFNPVEVAELAKEQDEWLDKEFQQDSINPWKHLMVFQHIPLFLQDEDEPADIYFNMKPEIRKKLLERFKKANVAKVFCGHYHRNAGGYTKDKKLEVVVTTAIGAQLGSDKHGFRVVQVNEDSIEHKFVAISDQVN